MMFIARKPPTPRRISSAAACGLVALAVVHLEGEAAAVAAEGTRLAVDLALLAAAGRPAAAVAQELRGVIDRRSQPCSGAASAARRARS